MQRHGRRALDRSRNARLVPRRLGRDDGRDDVPVGRADGRAVLAHDQGAVPACCRCSSRRATSSRGPAPGLLAFAVARAGGGSPATCWRGIAPGAGSPGATLLVAAAYELTPLKDVCLGKCRSPLGFLLGAWRDGRAGALRMGAKNGAWCVGCCWALMASLFALGVMSIAWMAFVAALIAVEKTLPWRRVATYGDGGRARRLGRAAARRARGDPGAHGARTGHDDADGLVGRGCGSPAALRDQSGYSSLRQARGSSGPAFGVRRAGTSGTARRTDRAPSPCTCGTRVPFSRAKAMKLGPSRRPSSSLAPTWRPHSSSHSGGSSSIPLISGISWACSGVRASPKSNGKSVA